MKTTVPHELSHGNRNCDRSREVLDNRSFDRSREVLMSRPQSWIIKSRADRSRGMSERSWATLRLEENKTSWLRRRCGGGDDGGGDNDNDDGDDAGDDDGDDANDDGDADDVDDAADGDDAIAMQ